MTQPGTWPSPGDYSTAIQNPQNCFNDPELKQGRPALNALGLPVGMSGNFAVVYQLTAGARKYAVRCFIRPVTDQQQRYDALSRYLSGFWLPSLADFVYLSQGIRVAGQWHPVVRMEWVAGAPLQRYVADNLRQGQVLGRLAAQWRGVVAGLSGAHTAHGDLQHGNILVSGGQIRLVDYDGFFLPALRGQPPGEVGHPNYQHPERLQKGYYEENADAFSALVIYLSLLALQSDPGLWQFHNGENLILKADDLQRPGQTPVWSRLRGGPDAEVRRLAMELAQFCRGTVADVPDLETVLQRLLARPVPAPGPVAPPPISRPGVAPPLPVQPAPPPVIRPAVPPVAVPPAPPAALVCPECGHRNAAGEVYCQRCARPSVSTRPCSRCGWAVPANAPYCARCGRPAASPTSVCPACRYANAAGEPYCQSCGRPLTGQRSCPHCGRTMPSNLRYCPECGGKV